MSEAKRGKSTKIPDEATRLKMSKARQLYWEKNPITTEERAARSIRSKGRKVSEETKKKMSMNRLGKKRGPYKKKTKMISENT